MRFPVEGRPILRVRVARSPAEMSRRAAAQILAALRAKPDLLLGVASGDTPTRTYERLARARATAPALFRRLRVVKLDEWLGLPMSHPATCETYVSERILGPLGVDRSRYLGFRSRPRDPRAECRRMERWLERRGPLDVCVLGLGRNGHLLMNEPGPALDPAPHVARLSESTRRHPMLRATRRAPRRGLTVGLADILRSRKVLLLVSGPHKAAALRRALAGRVAPSCPASFLWLHPAVTVLCDQEAARGLRRRARR